MTNINILHQQFSEYGANAKEWLRKCALLLPDIERYEVWKKKGFSSIYEYAAKLASMSRERVDDALRILRHIKDKPALMEVARQKGVNAVRPVATIATESTEKYWAGQANQLSQNELVAVVRAARNTNNSYGETTITMNLKPKTADKLQKMCNGDWNELMQKFIELYEKSLEQEKPEKKENASQYMPKKIKQYVLKRANCVCEFPNCIKPYKHLHHIDRFASKKEHDPDRIVALCETHHKLAHKGLIDEGSVISNWEIREGPDYTNLNRFIDDKVQFYRRI